MALMGFFRAIGHSSTSKRNVRYAHAYGNSALLPTRNASPPMISASLLPGAAGPIVQPSAGSAVTGLAAYGHLRLTLTLRSKGSGATKSTLHWISAHSSP